MKHCVHGVRSPEGTAWVWSEQTGQNLATVGNPMANDNSLISDHISAFPGQSWPAGPPPRALLGLHVAPFGRTPATCCIEVFSKLSSKRHIGTFGATILWIGSSF